MIKKYIPYPFKQWLWFVFKSPARQYLGYYTILIDFKSWLYSLFSLPKNESISICIGIKNRSENLLTHLIPSLNNCDNKDKIELSIYDCGSDDVQNLLSEIKKIWLGKLIYTREVQAFARSLAFNSAIKQSTSQLIMACDADMSLPKDLFKKINKHCNKYTTWFPHVWFTNEDGSGRYYTESTGMFAAYKSIFIQTGGYDETIKEWGKEDWLLFFEFYKLGIACKRTNERTFIHHYHPSLKPKDFKPLF